MLLVFLVSCEKKSFDSDYPTTYSAISSDKISQMRSSFASGNIYMTTTLNEFGFCGYSGDPLIVDQPPINGIITEPDVIRIVKKFVADNRSETGVENADELKFSQLVSGSGYNGSIGWSLRSSNQKVDTIEVLYSSILFHLTNSEVTYCLGNWYPYIYIPENFKVDRDKARASLLDKVVSHSNIAGEPYYVTISAEDLNQGTTGLKIVPITTGDKIELRVAWLFNIPGPVYYKIYIDVMTGKIIAEEPTIYS
jgi:hypothetical protein